MDALLYLIPALGCGLMMVARMVLMGRMMRSHSDQTTNEDVHALREEVARLRAERGHDEAHADG